MNLAQMFHTGSSRRRKENPNSRAKQHDPNGPAIPRTATVSKTSRSTVLVVVLVLASVHRKADCIYRGLNPPPYGGGYRLLKFHRANIRASGSRCCARNPESHPRR